MQVMFGRLAFVLVIVLALLTWIGGYWSPFTVIGYVFNGGAALVNGDFADRVRTKKIEATERRESGLNIFNRPAIHPGCRQYGLDWQCQGR